MLKINPETIAALELSTFQDMLRWSVTQFNKANLHYGHGTDNAWDEAIYLLLGALNLSPNANLNMILNAHLLRSERKHIIDLVERRVLEHKPIAYLTQQAWFAGRSFYVDERVIIPRSPIAELVERHFRPWIRENEIARILDLCTGSACIAISSALEMPQAQIDAADISSDALEVARINVEKYQVADRVRLIQSDLFQKLQDQIYDVIICNPPYVGQEEYATLPREYMHEPKISLYAEENGLRIIIKILQEAARHLSPNGMLIVEVGNSQKALIEKFPELPFVWIEFEHGDSEVFLLSAEQIRKIFLINP